MGKERGCVALHGREVSRNSEGWCPGCPTLPPGQGSRRHGAAWPSFQDETRKAPSLNLGASAAREDQLFSSQGLASRLQQRQH